MVKKNTDGAIGTPGITRVNWGEGHIVSFLLLDMALVVLKWKVSILSLIITNIGSDNLCQKRCCYLS
jgi:hypothetical protein